MAITTLPTDAEFEGPKAHKPDAPIIPDTDKTFGVRVGMLNSLLDRVKDVFTAVGLDDGTTAGSLREFARLVGKGAYAVANGQTISGADTIGAATRFVHSFNAAYTINLPALASITERRTILVLRESAGVVTFALNGASTINGTGSNFTTPAPNIGRQLIMIVLDPAGFHHIEVMVSRQDLLTGAVVAAGGIVDATITGSKLVDATITEAKIDPVYRSMIDPLSTLPSYGTARGLFEGPGCTDFLRDSAAAPFASGLSGTGAAVAEVAGTASRPGVAGLQTGTDTTGRAFFRTNNVATALGAGAWRFRADLNLAVAADVTDTYIGYSGFQNSNSGEPTNGAYFRYQYTENGGNWTCVTRTASVETTANSGVAAVHATAYRALEIEVNAAATSAAFYIDGALVGTITTNIPTGANTVGANSGIRKTAGTTSRTMLIDLMGLRFAATAGR